MVMLLIQICLIQGGLDFGKPLHSVEYLEDKGSLLGVRARPSDSAQHTLMLASFWEKYLFQALKQKIHLPWGLKMNKVRKKQQSQWFSQVSFLL